MGSTRNGQLAGCRILVVEDEPVIALDLAMILQGQGAVVLGPAMTVTEASALLEGCPPDAVVLDMLLGTEPSWPIVEVLAQRAIPFLIISASDEPVQARVDAPYLAKPVDPEELVEQLVRLTRSTPPSPYANPS
jgi:DNA-binding response OmpR family regulator